MEQRLVLQDEVHLFLLGLGELFLIGKCEDLEVGWWWRGDGGGGEW